MDEVRLRAVVDADSAGVIALIAAVFAEYPGCILDVDAEEPELRAPASSFAGFWVLEVEAEPLGAAPGAGPSAATIVGCAGLGLRDAADDGLVAELKKVYLDRRLRGRGLGARLIAHVEDEARRRGARAIELWSDTRFVTAHAVYRRLGYTCTGAQRELHDLSATTEVFYVKALSPGGGASSF